MSREPKRTGGKEDAQELVPILREAHARLRLWETCDKAGCRRCECCGGDVDRCGAGAAPEGWAWLRQVLNAMWGGASQEAAVEAANFAALGYRQRRTVRWHVKCWDPVEFVQLKDGTWVRAFDVPSRPPLDPKFFALAASPWLRDALADALRADARRDTKMQRSSA